VPPLSYPHPRLGDEVVGLRRWEATDVDCVREGKRCDRREALDWISRHEERRSGGAGISFAIVEPRTDAALGAIGLLFRPMAGSVPVGSGDGAGLVFEPDDGMVGIGYWVLERARRRGLASSAVSLVADWALSEAGLVRVEALVEPDNVASARVLEQAGFEREGRLGSYLVVPGGRVDVLIYSRLRAGTTARPAPPSA
jgi:[ribosomal protein S5]-alanine N-acetyltransferase